MQLLPKDLASLTPEQGLVLPRAICAQWRRHGCAVSTPGLTQVPVCSCQVWQAWHRADGQAH